MKRPRWIHRQLRDRQTLWESLPSLRKAPFIAAILLLLVALGAPGFVFGQAPVTIDDFSGGTNVNPNPKFVKQNQAREMSNAVLDDPIGSFRARPGIATAWLDILNPFGGNYYSQILSMYAQRFDDGKPYLFRVEARNDSATADMYVSAPYEYAPSKKLAGRIYPERGSWVQWNGEIYYFDRHNDPIILNRIVDSFSVRSIAVPAPGQLKATPIGPTGNLLGTYIWALVTHWRCDTAGVYHWSKRFSPLSRPITFNGEKSILTNFTQIIGDSCAAAPSVDTFMIVRTRSEKLDYLTDSLFRVGIVTIASASVPTYQYVDNMADAALTDTNYWRTIRDTANGGTWNGDPIIFTSTDNYQWFWGDYSNASDPDFGFGPNQAYAVGQSTFAKKDTGYFDRDTVSGTNGGSDLAGYQIYHIALWDTLTRQMGDTGVGAFFGGHMKGGAPLVEPYRSRTINLPKTTRGGLARIIIRRDYLYPDSTGSLESWNSHRRLDIADCIGHFIDTIRDSTVTQFHDTRRPNLLDSTSRIYERKLAPLTVLKGGVIHEGRLYAYDDNQVYFSESDTGSTFGFFNQVELGIDDGEKILGITSNNGYLLVMKTGSIWTLYTDGAGNPVQRSRRGSDYGMAAPNSMGSILSNPVYLSDQGVANLSDNPYRTNSPVPGYLSQNVWPLIRRPANQMLMAQAQSWLNRYLLSFPGTDSTFVYFGLTGGWSVWSFSFNAACLYDTVHGSSAFGTFVFSHDTTNTVTGRSGRTIYALSDSAGTDDGTIFGDGVPFSATYIKDHVAEDETGQLSVKSFSAMTECWPWGIDIVTPTIIGAILNHDGDSICALNLPYGMMRDRYGARGGKSFVRTGVDCQDGSVAVGVKFTIPGNKRGFMLNNFGIIVTQSGLPATGGDK